MRSSRGTVTGSRLGVHTVPLTVAGQWRILTAFPGIPELERTSTTLKRYHAFFILPSQRTYFAATSSITFVTNRNPLSSDATGTRSSLPCIRVKSSGVIGYG